MLVDGELGGSNYNSCWVVFRCRGLFVTNHFANRAKIRQAKIDMIAEMLFYGDLTWGSSSLNKAVGKLCLRFNKSQKVMNALTEFYKVLEKGSKDSKSVDREEKLKRCSSLFKSMFEDVDIRSEILNNNFFTDLIKDKTG